MSFFSLAGLQTLLTHFETLVNPKNLGTEFSSAFTSLKNETEKLLGFKVATTAPTPPVVPATVVPSMVIPTPLVVGTPPVTNNPAVASKSSA